MKLIVAHLPNDAFEPVKTERESVKKRIAASASAMSLAALALLDAQAATDRASGCPWEPIATRQPSSLWAKPRLSHRGFKAAKRRLEAEVART